MFNFCILFIKFRDFAYVIRDKNSKKFLCHVFRCDTSSRIIANALKDACKNLMSKKRPSSLNDSEKGIPERRVTSIVFFFEYLYF